MTFFLTTNAKSNKSYAAKSSEYRIQYSNQVKQILKEVNPQEMWEKLSYLTSFQDRAAIHESGRQAAYWIKNQLELWTKSTGRDDVTISLIQTDGTWPGTDINFRQPSVIVKIGNSSLPGIVVGAHIDTMASCGETVSCDQFPDKLKDPLPGADDDGSGAYQLKIYKLIFLAYFILNRKSVYLKEYGMVKVFRQMYKTVYRY